MTPEEAAAKELALNEAVVRHLGADKVRFETVFGITIKGTLHGVAISSQPYGEPRKWDKLETVIYPREGQGLPELLQELATRRVEILEAPNGGPQVLRASVGTVIPGRVIAGHDHYAVAATLEGAFTEGLTDISLQLANQPGGLQGAVGFNHFHVTLTVEGELVREGDDER